MSGYTSTMSSLYWGQPLYSAGTPRYSITIEWTWPTGGYWTRFQIVRTIGSPADFIDDGIRLVDRPIAGSQTGELLVEGETRENWEFYRESTGNPIYRDVAPPPGDWLFYTLFVLDSNRVWHRVQTVSEVSPKDHGWTSRLPELLPGVSVSEEQGVVAEPDQNHDVVQFLQGPGVYFDAAVTMGEQIQYYWDPQKVPPAMVEDLAASWGYKIDPSLGLARNRDLVSALRYSQGSIPAVERIVRAISGTAPYRVEISNNLMLDVGDSSFEGLGADASLSETRWYPTSQTRMARWDNWNGPIPGYDPNLLHEYYLVVESTSTRRFHCCTRKEGGGLDLVRGAIPISGWSQVRTGCYATSSASARITMGMDVYSIEGGLIGTLTTVPSTALTNQWADYSTLPVTDWNGVPFESLYEEGEEPRHAYGVPWFEVSNACLIDLIVVDDG